MQHELQLHIDILSDDDMLVLRSGSSRARDQQFIAKHLAGTPQSVNHAVAPNQITALHVACAMGPMKSVRTLLQAGANPTLKATDGTTALALAKRKRRHQLVRLLEQHIQNTKEPACCLNP